MALGAMPRPISYALSIVIVGIGLAVSYQVFLGSSFSYEGQLGSIQLGKGDNATTLAEFVEQSQEALTAAQASIASLEKENQELQQQLVAYEKTIDELKIAARKSEDTEVAASIASISDQVAAWWKCNLKILGLLASCFSRKKSSAFLSELF